MSYAAPMSRSLNRSISVPIVISSITVLMTLALLSGWILVISKTVPLTHPFTGNRWWLLAGGIASFVLVMSVLVMFSVSLVREILESRRQQMFIDSVTHELKSPLASIKLCLDTLARPELSAIQQTELRNMMLSDVERLTVFVDDILQASRIAHRRRSQTWTVVDISRLLTRATESIRARYELAPEAFRLDVPQGVEIFTDPTALEIILKNVLDNAVKYSSGLPQVDVHSSRLKPASSASSCATVASASAATSSSASSGASTARRIRWSTSAPVRDWACMWHTACCAIWADGSGRNRKDRARAPPCASACR